MSEYEPVETLEEYFKENGCLARRVFRSYVALLTEKNGSEVKAVRLHTDKKKGQQELFDDLEEVFPELNKWNVKGIWRLNEEDFKK